MTTSEKLAAIQALLDATPKHYQKPDQSSVLSVEPTVSLKRSDLVFLLELVGELSAEKEKLEKRRYDLFICLGWHHNWHMSRGSCGPIPDLSKEYQDSQMGIETMALLAQEEKQNEPTTS